MAHVTAFLRAHRYTDGRTHATPHKRTHAIAHAIAHSGAAAATHAAAVAGTHALAKRHASTRPNLSTHACAIARPNC